MDGVLGGGGEEGEVACGALDGRLIQPCMFTLCIERTMLLGVVLAVLLDVGHPRGVCLGIDGRDDDNGGAGSNCDLGEVHACVAAPSEEPHERQEAQYPQRERPQPPPAQEILQRRRDGKRILAAYGGGRDVFRGGMAKCMVEVWMYMGARGAWSVGRSVGGRQSREARCQEQEMGTSGGQMGGMGAYFTDMLGHTVGRWMGRRGRGRGRGRGNAEPGVDCSFTCALEEI